jgi:hypothetical protein
MMRRRILTASAIAIFSFLTLMQAQRSYMPFHDDDDSPAPLPPDANEKTEWAFARLIYPSGRFYGTRGYATIDSPKADRQFSLGVRRLTRIHTRSKEEYISLDGDEVFKWPWLYAVETGHWTLTDDNCKKLREYLLRGGFLMTDDFHGTEEWEVFLSGMNRIFPDRPIVEIENSDPIFHVLYDLDHRVQVPGLVNYPFHKTFEKDGIVPHWRAIYDDRGRIMVAMCFNQDNGDAWEWADSPRYPEKFASQAFRMGINYIIYSMTH